MLGAPLVIGAVVAPVEHGPDGLAPIGMGVALYVLLDAVLDLIACE